MHVDSIYAATKRYDLSFPRLEGEQQTDVAIIGSGLTGVSAALELAAKGYQVSVVEAEDISWGASGRSGGQMIVGVGDHADKMIELLGLEDAQKGFGFSVEAIELIKQRVAQYGIDCDLTEGQIEVAAKASHMPEYDEMIDLYREKFDYHLERKSAEEVSEILGSKSYFGGAYDPLGGHIHPLNYTLGLAKAASEAGVKFYEHSAITEIQQGEKPIIRSAHGSIRCRYLVIAANAYLDKLVPKLAKYILPVGSYICATEPVPDSILPSNPAVCDSNYLLSYFRKDAAGRLLWGGRTGLRSSQPSNVQQVIRRRFSHAFPELANIKIEKAWGGNVAITMNRMPQIGRLDKNSFYIHGYSGHGIAMTGMGGRLIAEAVAGHAERFEILARTPHKAYPGGTLLRAPGLAAAMIYFYLKDLLS